MAGSMSDVPTILDYLNEDCWRAVLKYVPVQDIIRTERTSRRWQGVVLTYLRSTGVRIGIFPYYPHVLNKQVAQHNRIKVYDAHLTSFKKWTDKLGSLVIFAYCDNFRMLDIIRKNCPNIEAITIYHLRDVIDENGSFESLRRIRFDHCFSLLVDYFVSEPMCNNNTLEELQIVHAKDVTLHFFINAQLTNLKSLILEECLVSQSLGNLLAASCLGQLTTFELHKAPKNFYEHISLLLDKMPKLERLRIDCKMRSSSFFESVSRLRHLKHLEADFLASDEDLKAVTTQCLELEILILRNCEGVSWRGVAALCRNAGARLTKLFLRKSPHVVDDDVVAVISSCPNLEVLDLLGCERVTHAAVPRAAAARRALGLQRRPLSLEPGYDQGAYIERLDMFRALHQGPLSDAATRLFPDNFYEYKQLFTVYICVFLEPRSYLLL